jgi:histidinol-phosphatase
MHGLSRVVEAAATAADRARAEILPRFRRTRVETKADGSPVTEADREAEKAVRAALTAVFPEYPVVGEELGGEPADGRPYWLVDPIDGTIAFSRGIPLFSTIISLVDDGEPVMGLIDLPMLGERYIGWRGGGCRRRTDAGEETVVRVSHVDNIGQAMVAHGDAVCFARSGYRAVFGRMAREIPMLRGYTDAFGHAMVLSGGVDAMVDLHLDPWDAAATQLLVSEAGGRCDVFPVEGDKLGLVFGAPGIVEELRGWFAGPKTDGSFAP